MKRTILAIAALLTIGLSANAQFNFGIKAGYNSSLNLKNIASTNPQNYVLNDLKGELKNGFHLGVFARIGKKIYVQPELLYGLQKKDYQFTIQDAQDQSRVADINNHVTFSTIDIPVLLGYKIVDAKILNVRAFAGPKIKLNAGSKLSIQNLTDGSTFTKEELDEVVNNEFKNASVGLELGAGVDVLMFTLDARMNVFNDVYAVTKESKPDLSTNFVISLGYKF